MQRDAHRGSNCDGTDADPRVLRHCFRDVPASFLEVAFDSRTLSCRDRVARRSGGDAQVDDANGVYVGQVRESDREHYPPPLSNEIAARAKTRRAAACVFMYFRDILEI